MGATLGDLGRLWRPLVPTVIGLFVIAVIAATLQLPGLTILWSFVWLSAGGALVVGLFLLIRSRRPIAGAGAILAGVAIVVGFLWRTPPAGVVWTLLLL